MKQQQKFYFGGAFYLQVLQGLYRTLSESNVAVLLGESGVGKSSLCAKLRQYLLRQRDSVLLLSEPPPSPEILRSILARELDLPDSASLAVLLPDALLSRSEGSEFKPLTLILDDAHMLSDVTLMELTHLSLARVNDKPALRLLLSGEATLAERLAKLSDLNPLWEAVNEGTQSLIQLEPMSAEELESFLLEYLRQSGRLQHSLSSELIQRLHKSCHGYPGPALKLAAQLVQDEFADTSSHYSAGSAGEEDSRAQPSLLGGTGITGGRMQSWLTGAEQRQTRALLPVAAVIVLASLGFVYQQLTATSDTELIGGTGNEIEQQVASDAREAGDTQSSVTAASAVDTAEFPFVEAPVSGEEVIAEAEQEEESPVLASELAMSEEQLNREALLAALERARVAAQEQLAADQPVSDSGLVLVTAAQRGISEDSFALPEIDVLLATQEDSLEAQRVPGQVVETIEQTVAAVEVNEENADPGVSHVLGQSLQQTTPNSGVAAERGEVEAQGVWQDRVAGWVSAWQEQDLDAYFSYYHSRFVPRYQNSLSAWRDNRARVIGGATGIELEMYDFDVISESPDEVEVHFWLDYRSPSYQDQTRKKIVLAPYEGSWLIIEEINLEVRV